MSTKFILDSPDLVSAISSLKIAGPELRKQIYEVSRNAIAPEWQSALYDVTGGNNQARRVLADTARVNVGTRGVNLTSAKSAKKLRGGLVPKTDFAAVELGATWKTKEIRGRRGGTRYTYTRTVNKGFKPRRRTGYYVFPTADKFVFRFAALFVTATARTLHDAVEGKIS